ncbi:MAG: CO dehydrogenase/CO-methylating acetyl-CoA synthase complex subunit beta [Firmicutes bacterium]|nr:CO dehydrogenase/CO-methylating acetyl-CoA synthase complex subunit beta [Bacillota bacterium]
MPICRAGKNKWENSFDKIYEWVIECSRPPLALFQKAYNGVVAAICSAKYELRRSLLTFGQDYPVSFPETDYYLPVIRSLSGEKVTRLGELAPILDRVRSRIKKELNFGNALLCGEATAYAEEIVEALRCLNGRDARTGVGARFPGDSLLRSCGILLADWSIPGQAILMGKAKSAELLQKVVADLQAKGFLIFLAGEVAEQAVEAGIKLGEDYLTFALGGLTGAVHALGFALRVGLAFGGIAPGARDEQRDYQWRRIRAFVLHFGQRDDLCVANHFAAIFLGFPVLADHKLPGDEQIPDWYISHPYYDTLIRKAMEVRGIKLKIAHIPVPFAVSYAFEGEAIREEEMYLELGGSRAPFFELVTMVDESGIEDGKAEVIGPDVDRVEEGVTLGGGICVKVYGRRMQKDFEAVIERRIHEFINWGQGLRHEGQRDACRYRVSRDCVARGFKFRHYGELLIARIKEVFSEIVDRVQVTVYTDPKAAKEKLEEARGIYAARDARLAGLTDESVEVFYSCAICQSLAPNHICIITPERPGLCGAVSWLDAKVSFELNPAGPHRLIGKQGLIDAEKGIWKSINDFVFQNSNGTVKTCSLYSFLDHPTTSCGFFECITGIVPEANGVMITTREHRGMTPCGMDFSTLAGFVGNGVQTPGFMGHGKDYILSKKFIRADGGLARVVWMPCELKGRLGDGLRRAAVSQGLGTGFVDKIADEAVGATVAEILPFLKEKGHPALRMKPLI